MKYSNAFGEDELKEVARTLDDFQFTLYNLEGRLAQKTVEISMRKGLTVYDASYMALALILDTEVYTADEKLRRKTLELGIVKHITEFKL